MTQIEGKYNNNIIYQSLILFINLLFYYMTVQTNYDKIKFQKQIFFFTFNEIT